MATETVGSLLVSLGFNSAEFDRGIGKATQQARSLSTTFNATSKEVAVAANRMGVSMGAFTSRVMAVKASLDPAGTALINYRNQVNLLRESYKLGAISQAQFITGMQGAMGAYRANGAQVVRTNGQMQSGMQQLGFQLNDVATQFASGTRPMQIFAQQSGQVIQAIGLMAGGAGRFGAFLMGPWGIALTAGVVALSPFIGKLFDTAFAADTATKALQGVIDKQAEAAKGAAEQTNAQLGLNKAREELMQIEERLSKRPKGPDGTPMFSYKDLKRQQELRWTVAAGQAALRAVGNKSDSAAPTTTTRSSGGGGGARSLGSMTGASASAVAARFASERAGIMQSYNSTMAGMAMNAEEEAEYQLRNVELQRIRAIQAINADKEYSAAQKTDLIAQQEELVEEQRRQVEREKTRRIEQEAEATRQQEFQVTRERLQMQMSMADTEVERQNIALQLLAMDQEARKQALERTIASEIRTDAEKALAQQALDALATGEMLEQKAAMRANETSAQAYMRGLNKTPGQINEAIDQIKIGGLEALNDGIVDAIVNFKSLGDVASSILKQVLADLLRLQIQQAIMKPLAQALGLAIPGFANGTNFAPGGMAIVGERGPELVNLPRGSQVIPNHELGGMGGAVHKPTFVFPGVTNERMAREAATQAARRYRRELSPMRGM